MVHHANSSFYFVKLEWSFIDIVAPGNGDEEIKVDQLYTLCIAY